MLHKTKAGNGNVKEKVLSFSELGEALAKKKAEVELPKFDKADVGIAGRIKGVHTEIIWVRPSEMEVDLTYQRDPQKRWATKGEAIAAKFDPRCLGLMAGVRRAGRDKITLIDGALRHLVMQRIQYNEPVALELHKHIKTIQEEAEWFLKLNPDEASKVNPAQKYKARLVAREPLALAIEAEATAGGLKVTGGGYTGITVQSATALHELGCLTRVGKVKAEVWPDLKVPGQFYIAIGALLESCSNIKIKRLKQTLSVAKKPGYENIFEEIEAEVYKKWSREASHARDMAPRALRIMAQTYNKALKGAENKIAPRLTRVNTAWAHRYEQWNPIDD